MSKINIVYYQGYWDTDITRSLPKWLFIYGDNDERKGLKGQAVIRNEPNAMGIPTKKKPRLTDDSFYTDTEYKENTKKIQASINAIHKVLLSGKYTDLVLNENIGMGLAQLDKKAPLTYKFLISSLEELRIAVSEIPID